MCDHTIMNLHGNDSMTNFVTISEVKKAVHDAAKYANEYSFIMDSSGEMKTAFEPKHWLDRRRGLSTLFNFCPYCGEKINWRKIRAAI